MEDAEKDIRKAKENSTVFTVIILDGEVVIALTSCEGDMTWGIVRAFMLLDSVPPVTYASLPGMAGEHNEELRAIKMSWEQVIQEMEEDVRLILE